MQANTGIPFEQIMTRRVPWKLPAILIINGDALNLQFGGLDLADSLVIVQDAPQYRTGLKSFVGF